MNNYSLTRLNLLAIVAILAMAAILTSAAKRKPDWYDECSELSPRTDDCKYCCQKYRLAPKTVMKALFSYECGCKEPKANSGRSSCFGGGSVGDGPSGGGISAGFAL